MTPGSPARNTRSSDHPPLPMVDDPDQAAREIHSVMGYHSMNDSQSMSEKNQDSVSVAGSSGTSTESSISSTDTVRDFFEKSSSKNSYKGHANLYPHLEEVSQDSSSSYEETHTGIGFHNIYQRRKGGEERKQAQAFQGTPLKYVDNEDKPKGMCSKSSETTPMAHPSEKQVFTPKMGDFPSRPQIYRCKNCQTAFLSEEVLEKHCCFNSSIAQSDEEREQAQASQETPLKHVDNKDKPKGMCSKSSGTTSVTHPSEKRGELNDPSRPTVYRCENCGNTFLTIKKRDQHSCNSKSPVKNPNKVDGGKHLNEPPMSNYSLKPQTYCCKLCSNAFASEEALKKHHCSKAQGQTTNVTPNPHAKGSIYPPPYRHKSQSSGLERCNIPLSPAVLYCPYCSKHFLKQKYLENHKCSKAPQQ